MARDSFGRSFSPTAPDDVLDPPRFSQVTETVKDCLVLELRRFFENAQQSTERRIELPTIEKYATFGPEGDRFSTSVSVIRKMTDKKEALPHIAVMTSTGAERRMAIGTPFVATVQDPATIVATVAEPYALSDGDLLVVRTLPNGKKEALDYLTFTADRFPTANPIGAALAVDVARVINEQSMWVEASVLTTGGHNYLQVSVGGPRGERAPQQPTELEVSPLSKGADTVFGLSRSGSISSITAKTPDPYSAQITAPAGTWSSADVNRYLVVDGASRPYFNDGRFLITGFATGGGTDTLTVSSKYARTELTTTAGWFIGLRDDYLNPAHPPKQRYGQGFDLQVQVDVISSGENTRGELVDLVGSFFSFWLESKMFTFWGRTGFPGQTTTNESYQVVLNPPVSSSGESEVPRNADGTDKAYVNSFTVSTTITMYLDREVFWPGTNTPAITTDSTLVYDSTLTQNTADLEAGEVSGS